MPTTQGRCYDRGMRYRTAFAIAAVILIAAFLIINWSLFAAPASLNLLVTSVQIPVGVVMLGLFAVIILALTVYVGMWQSTFLSEYRRQARELQVQRTLADDAEASRFTELGALVRTELAGLEQRMGVSLDALRSEFRDTESSIAATLGELDDRIHRNARNAS